MDFCYLSFLLILAFRSILSYSQHDLPSTSRLVMIINMHSHPIDFGGISDEQTWRNKKLLKLIMHSEILGKDPIDNFDTRVNCDGRNISVASRDLTIMSSTSFNRDNMEMCLDCDGIGVEQKVDDENIFILRQNGVNDLSGKSLEMQHLQRELNVMQIPSAKLNDTITEKSLQLFSPDLVIQVGAFLHESNSLALRDRLSDLLNKPVIIVPSDGYFKVRIIGFTGQEEMEKLLPTLGLLGIKNIWIFRVKKKEDIKPQVVVRPDTTPKTVVEKIDSLDITKEKNVVAEPNITLQVGIFHERSEALRAQRRISTKLNLPVEIVKEWEYYVVFITGFKTREEIFKYYPQLAALGYPKSNMIEKYNKKH